MITILARCRGRGSPGAARSLASPAARCAALHASTACHDQRGPKPDDRAASVEPSTCKPHFCTTSGQAQPEGAGPGTFRRERSYNQSSRLGSRPDPIRSADSPNPSLTMRICMPHRLACNTPTPGGPHRRMLCFRHCFGVPPTALEAVPTVVSHGLGVLALRACGLSPAGWRSQCFKCSQCGPALDHREKVEPNRVDMSTDRLSPLSPHRRSRGCQSYRSLAGAGRARRRGLADFTPSSIKCEKFQEPL